jgi:two-component system, LytTR family, sensor kinase
VEKSIKNNIAALIALVILIIIIVGIRMLVEGLLPIFHDRFGLDFGDYLFQTLSNYPITITMIVADFVIVKVLVKKISYDGKIYLKTFIEFICVSVISLCASVVYGLLNAEVIFYSFITNFLFNVVLVIILDLSFYYRWVNKKALNREIEQRVKANYKYQLLKSEMDPHFLFNSLNVLDQLIFENQEKASEYVNKLALVYRYLLKIESDSFVLLEEELEFVKKYVDLLNERFGNGLVVKIEIPEKYHESKIIPCAIQMMIENAVKHNVVNTNHTLYIDVKVSGDELEIKNNICRKKKIVSHTGIGINNIREQYQLLFNKDITISDDNKFFVVKIPIVQ